MKKTAKQWEPTFKLCLYLNQEDWSKMDGSRLINNICKVNDFSSFILIINVIFLTAIQYINFRW